MLRSLEELENYKVKVSDSDEDIGNAVRFLIDDEHWTVRYLVVQTGGLLSFDRETVLISPISFGQVDWSTRRFHLALTMDKVTNSPSVDFDQSVSRQHEQEHHNYFGYPDYWGEGNWGIGADPGELDVDAEPASAPDHDSAATSGDVHLRSDDEVRGYRVQGTDDAIGHIEDFIVDDETWEVRYLVVNTRRWLLGKKILVSPQWASRISWEDSTVYVDLSREVVKDSPKWNTAAGISRAYEVRLHDYYGRTAYWERENKPIAASPSTSETRAR